MRDPEKTSLRPEALSRDGYIIDQRKTRNIPFGRLTSDRNGCGWIACYNFLRAIGRDPDPEALVRQMEKTLLAGGYLGVHVAALVWELRRQQVPLRYAIRPIHAQMLAETAPAGIILYHARPWNHFVAFRREADGRLRFFGATPGDAGERGSLAEFYWKHVRFPLTLTITAGQLSANDGHSA